MQNSRFPRKIALHLNNI